MKTISNNQRTVNILNKALELGFEFNINESIEQAQLEAENFIMSNSEGEEVECEVKSLSRHGQRVDFNDGMGLEYWCQGEIVDFSKHWHKSTDTKVFHTDLIDSLGNYLKLYYLVGQTDYNNF